MQSLQEKVLIKKIYFYFLIPSLLMGILSVYFPLLFALVPAHESGECICNLTGLNLLNISSNALLVVNTLVFYSVNWGFLMTLILMLN
jgi:hypothetical protein